MSIQYKPVVAALLPQHEGALTYDAMPRGSWLRRNGRLFVRCGDCGFLLHCHHAVDDAGEVTPSVGCPQCGWHVWATLEGAPC